MAKKNHQKNLSLLILAAFFGGFVYWVFVVFQNSNPPQNPPINPSQTTDNSPLTIISGPTRVIDGDTVEIDKKRIRLIGIDAPESKQKCLDKNYYEYLCGEASTNFLKNLIENKNVECQSGEKDIYKRYLGRCKFGNIDINYAMVKNGMAIIYNLKDADGELRMLESEARNKKLGIWQGAFQEPKEYRKKNRHQYHKN